MSDSSSYDVIIIGGGPAGCTAGTLLAKKGRRVLLLEKEKMPRYHIGESLMPFCWFTLEKLGVLEEMKQHEFVQKLSVQFVNPDGMQSRPFYFFQHNEHPSSYTWQVERADFDLMLFNNAIKNGVDARQESKVVRVVKDEYDAVVGVVARHHEGGEREYRAPITIDCSGREAFWMSKNQWRKRDPELNNVAIWTYYKGAKRDEGLDAGSTTVAYIPNKGWFWYIPLRNDVVSVGVVADRDYLFRDGRDPAAIMDREIEENVWIKDHLEQGEQFGEYWVTGEYSYRAQNCAADGMVLAGDAFVFLDPVFSSGVFLAFKSGEMAADAVDAAVAAISGLPDGNSAFRPLGIRRTAQPALDHGGRPGIAAFVLWGSSPPDTEPGPVGGGGDGLSPVHCCQRGLFAEPDGGDDGALSGAV